jgi:alpha-mannosidase
MGHVHVIATQHLDVAWLWTRVPQGEDIMRQCFERAIAMIEAYPEHRFVFSRSTAWSFWVVQQRYPALFEKIRKYVQADQIELCGGEWVEPDHLIPSGESLVRQSALGQWYYQETFGKLARVCWDPDIFGHAHTLPQIIKKIRDGWLLFPSLQTPGYGRAPAAPIYLGRSRRQSDICPFRTMGGQAR